MQSATGGMRLATCAVMEVKRMTEQLGKCSKGWLLKNYFGVRRIQEDFFSSLSARRAREETL